VDVNLADTTPRVVHILLIEDSEHDAVLVERYLGATAHQRFELTVARTLGSGVDRLADGPPDCVLLDLSLPDASGLEALVALREEAPTVPVIVLTGHDDDFVGEASLSSGAQDFIAKSDLKASILRRSIRHAITRQRQQRLLEAAFDELAQEAAVREQAEHALTRSAADLARSNADLSDFAYVAAHDLRSPLGTISGYTQLLGELSGVTSDAEAMDIVRHIHGGVRKMQELIDDLLAYCSIGSDPPRQDKVDLTELASAVCEPIVRRAGHGAVLTVGDLPVVVGDEGQLSQLLDNLTTNAVKFVPAGIAAEVTVTAEPAEGTHGWFLTVADNGIGISPADRDRVFGMFQRLNGEGGVPGTGIGLAICQRVVERHGGRIWVEGNEPTGTRMRVWLPEATWAPELL
jgi:signal transduction histidine kinase